MDRVHELEVLIAVAEAGSFAKAGKRLRISPPAVTRAIMALEERLGARVFNRTTRNLSITDAGRRFLDSARRIVSELDHATREAVGEKAAPHGHLAVTASVTFGRLSLTPVVCAFLEQHPRVSVSMLLLDRIANLAEEGIDLAVRIGALRDSALVARKVGTVRRILVASPAYLARHGMPRSPADLRRHAVIAFTGLMPNREWRYQDGNGTAAVTLAPRLEINDAFAATTAAEAGDGITVALSYMVADQIRGGRLVPLLIDVTPPPVPVHLVHLQSRLIDSKLRAFVDFAAPRLRATLERSSLPGSTTARPG